MSWHSYIVSSAPSAAPADIYIDGAFQPNQWAVLADDAEIPAEGRVFLSLSRWTTEKESLIGSNRALGVVLRAGEDVHAIGPDTVHLAAIALDFPKYGDGRAYSYAALLRTRYGFAGELRAMGDVLIDQIPAMKRVGFTALEIRNPHTRKALENGHDVEVKQYYQPAVREEVPAGTRPWHRTAG